MCIVSSVDAVIHGCQHNYLLFCGAAALVWDFVGLVFGSKQSLPVNCMMEVGKFYCFEMLLSLTLTWGHVLNVSLRKTD